MTFIYHIASAADWARAERDGQYPYPHIYGALNTDAVREARPFAPAPDGEFAFDAGK